MRYHSYLSCGILELVGEWIDPGKYETLSALAHSMFRHPDPSEYSSIGYTAAQYINYYNKKIPHGSNDMYVGPKSWVLYSGPAQNGWAEKLTKQVTDLGLGPVAVHGPVHNPNTGRNIVLHIWTVDLDKFKKWYHLGLTEKTGKDTITINPAYSVA